MPVGSSGFESSEMRSVVVNLNHELVRLSSLACPHSASLILRQCLGSARVMYLLRTLRFSLGTELASLASQLLRSSWGVVLGVTLAHAQWPLATLPIHLGGLGAQDPAQIRPRAAVSSLLLAAKHSAVTGIQCSAFPADLLAAVSALRASAPALSSELLQCLSELPLAVVMEHQSLDSWSTQSSWTAARSDAAASR